MTTGAYAKKIKIKVTIKNLTGETISADFNVGKNIADPNTYAYLTKKMSPTDLVWSFETEKDIENFSVVFGSANILKNNLPAGKISGKPVVVSKGGVLNYTWEAKIDKSNKRSLDDLSSSILQYQPNLFINDDISPKSLSGLFNQYLGGVQAYRITSTDTIYEYRVAPIDLGLALKIGEIKGSQTSNQQIDFSNKTDQGVKVSIPAISELGLSFSFNKMHSVKLEYKDIGVIDWIKTSSMNSKPTSNVLKEDMPIADQIELGRLYTKFGDSLKLRRIDKAYVFDGIYLEHSEGTIITSGNEIDISTFVTNSGTYDFKNSNKTSKVFGSSYLGYWISNSSPNFAALLEYFGAVYSAQIPKILTDEELKEDYQKLRDSNPNLPDYQSPSEIRLFYNQKLNQYLDRNPTDRNNKSLQIVNTPANNPLIDNLNSTEIQELMNEARLRFDFIPTDISIDKSKDILKKLNSLDPNFNKRIKELNQIEINN